MPDGELNIALSKETNLNFFLFCCMSSVSAMTREEYGHCTNRIIEDVFIQFNYSIRITCWNEKHLFGIDLRCFHRHRHDSTKKFLAGKNKCKLIESSINFSVRLFDRSREESNT